jgi:type IV secretion system protein VirD4
MNIGGNEMKIDKKVLAKSLISNGAIIGAVDYVAVSSTVYFPKLMNAIPEPEKMTAVSDYFLNEWMMNPSNALHSAIQTPEIQLGALSLFLGLTVKDIWNNRKHKVEKASDYGAFGTSEFIKLKDIESDIKDFALDLNTAGTIIGMINGKPVIHRETSYKNRNVLVFGASGTQKSKSYIIPNILNTDSDSIIVTDPKGELYETTSEIKRKQGYSVHLMNFDITENETSDKYNSLDYIISDIDAAELGNTLVINANGLPANGDSFWINSEAGVIATLALYAKHFLPKEQQHLGSVYNILVSTPKALHHLFKDIPDNHIVKRSYNGCIGNKEEKMRAQIMGGASSAIDLWKYDETRNLTYTSDFNLMDLGKKKMIIYVKMPVGKKYSRPLIATFFNQLFEQLYKLAESNHGTLPNPVRMLLDEFANIGQIPMFEERLSTTRSLGIYVTPVLQSIEQLRNRYGREKASEIMDNCDTHLFLGTNDKDAQKHFSEKLGMTTIRIQGESESKNERGQSSGESKNYVQRPLMTADEINRLPDDKSLVFMRTKQPMMLDKAYFTKLEPLAELMESKVKLHDYRSATSIPYDIYEPPKFKETKEKPKPKVDPLEEMMDSLMSQMPPDDGYQEPVAVRTKAQTSIDDFDF